MDDASDQSPLSGLRHADIWQYPTEPLRYSFRTLTSRDRLLHEVEIAVDPGTGSTFPPPPVRYR